MNQVGLNETHRKPVRARVWKCPMEGCHNCCQSLKKIDWGGVGGSIGLRGEEHGPCESWPHLHRSRSSPHNRGFVCVTWRRVTCCCHWCYQPWAFSQFSGFQWTLLPKTHGPFLLFVICRCVLQALPPYFSLLYPLSLGVKMESRVGWISGTGPVLATEAWSWAWSVAVCRLSETRRHWSVRMGLKPSPGDFVFMPWDCD